MTSSDRILCLISALVLATSSTLSLGCSSDSSDSDSPGTGEDVATSDETQPDSKVEWTSDFTPPSGAGDPPPGVPADDGGPWKRRILLATSSDGLIWTRKDEMLANQGDAQSMIVRPDGTIFVYYITNHESYRDELVAAVSPDNGETWYHKAVDITYVDGVGKAADPAMLLLPDGRLRMYFSGTSDSTGVKTRSAVSTDGFSFEQEAGVRFSSDTGPSTAPSVIQIGTTTHLFWIKGAFNGHATSTDALTFVDAGTVDLGMGNFIAESGLGFEDGHRMFVFGPPNTDGHELYFAHSADGESWTLEPQTLLPIDDGSSLESNGVRGATAAKLADGTYLMVYATNIPDDS